MKTIFFNLKSAVFFCLLSITPQLLLSQKCLDLGVGVGVNNNEYAFIDFFLGGKAWEIEDEAGHPWYKAPDLNYHKIVQGEYWTYDQDWSGDIDNDKWGDDWADCYINYTAMMFDQGKCDERGFPLQVPFTLYQYFPKSIDPNQGIDNSKPVTINQVNRKIYFPADLPQDGWIMKWKGKGKIRMQGIEVLNADVPYVVQGNSWNNVPGYVGKNIEFTSTAGGRVETKLFYMQHGWWFNILESDPTDPIRDIVFLFPGLEANYDAGEIFHPLFVERMKQFSALRFMGALSSNGLRSKDIVPDHHPYYQSHYLDYFKWSQRGPFNWYKSNNGDGLAYEYIIELANLTKIDPWVNLPYSCSPAYADSLVLFFLERLDPDLTLYLEVGNELWNTNYGGFHWINKKKLFEWPGLDNSEGRGAYINEIYGSITQAIGPAGLERVKRVLGAWPKYMSTNRRTVENMNPDNWDCFATTFYYDLKRNATSCLAPSGKSWRQELYEWHLANPTDQAGFNQKYKECILNEFRCSRNYSSDEDLQIAKIYNKELVCYEGGNHTLSGCENSITHTELPGERVLDNAIYIDYITDNSFINAACAAEESQEMSDVLSEVFDSLQSAGYTLCNFLSFSGRSSCYGAWDLIQAKDLNDDLPTLFTKYPKFKMFSDRIANANCDDVYINLPNNSVGAGNCIYLDGLNDYVEAASGVILDETSNYTAEAWFTYRLEDSDKAILAFNNDGANDNYNIVKIRNDNKLVWEIGNNGTFVMKLVGPVILANKWQHVAVSKNGNRYTLYLDGKNVASGNFTLSSMTRNHFTIGSVYDGAYGDMPFGGQIDEVRLWNVARTENQIRSFMCKKVTSADADFASLASYYRFDRPDQTTKLVYDMVTATNTGSLKNISFTIRSRYNVSGAPIGDVSKFVYSFDWSSTGLTLVHPDGDMMAVSNISNGNPAGVHLYMVNDEAYYNDRPTYYEGLITNRYFGVFVAGGNDVSYDLTYVYNGNPQALADGTAEMKHRLLKRADSNDEYWKHTGAKLDVVANALTVSCKEKDRGEYTLGFRPTSLVDYPGPGMALKFDYVVNPELEEGGVLKYLNLYDYTVTCWTKGYGELFNFTGKFKRGEERFRVDLTYGGLYVNAAFRYSNGVSNSAGFDPGTSPLVATPNEWVHWAVTRKGTKITVYANGLEVVSKDFLGTNLIEELRIFDQRGEANRDLTIDELSVWNKALTQSEIRDWMCKKLNEDHPGECENLVLYFNFDEANTTVLEDTRGPSDMVLYALGEYVPSGAAIGDESIHDYNNPNSLSFYHPNGDYIEVSKSSPDVVNGIQLYRVDNNPPMSSTVSGSTILSIDSSRYWGMFIVDANNITSTYNVVNHFGDNTMVVPGNESEVRMLSRVNHTAANWTANDGVLPNLTNKTVTLTSKPNSEFVLGGTTANTFITDCIPAQPVFVAETALINPAVICGNASGIAYVVQNDPMVESYIWSLPSGISGFSTSDTIYVNAELGFVSPPAFDISVKAVNRCGESAATIYSVTINPSSTLADAGPDQLILPPATIAIMDGNAVVSGETGMWSVGAAGTGTFTLASDPKTQVSAMATGTNYYVWSTDNGVCQPSTDTVKIIVAPPPQDIVDPVNGDLPSSVCGGAVYTLQAIPPEDIVPDSYQWTLPDGMSLLGQTGNEAIVQVGNGLGGVIQVSAVYAGVPSDPIESDIINIRAMPVKPVLSQDNDTVCLHSTFEFTALNHPSIDRYEWTFPALFVPTEYPTPETFNIDVEIKDSLVDYVKVKAYNGECTSAEAEDSLLVRVLVGPSPPVPEKMNRYAAQPRYDLCKYDKALLFVKDDDPDAYYVWEVPTYVPHEFITDNHSAGLFDITTAHTESIYVRKVRGTGACSVSAPLYIPTTSKTTISGSTVGAISLVSPAAQDPMDLQVGQQYTFESSGTSNYYWHLPEGIELVDDGDFNNNSLSVKVAQEFSGYLEVYGIEHEGCSQDMQRIGVCSNATGNCLMPPEYVSGTTEFCQGSNLNVTVANIVGATEYVWTLPNGQIETTPTNVIDVTISEYIYGDVSVVAKNATGQSQPATFYMRVLANPMAAIEFVDENNNVLNFLPICQTDRDRPVFIRDIGAGDYTWDIDNQILWDPTDASNGDRHSPKSSGSDTLIFIQFDANRFNNAPDPGTMTIVATNSCGSSVNASIPYDVVVPPVAQMPSFVQSPTSVCLGSSATYRINEIENADEYIWTIPSGFTTQSLITLIPELTVDIQAGQGGVITVYATSSVCGGGNSPTQTSEQITISGTPVSFDFIEAPLAGCPGNNLTYSVSSPGTSSISWTIPEGLSPNISGKTIIVDNSDPECVQFGNWTLEADVTNYNGDYLRQGNCDLNCIDGKRNSYDTYLIYNLQVPVTGKYKLYYSYNYANTDMYIDIKDISGVQTYQINQRTTPASGLWEYMGLFEFNAGTDGYVKVNTVGSGGNQNIASDAVKLELVEEFVSADTSIVFEVISGGNSSLCVTIDNPQCESGYSVCTDPINLGGTLETPIFLTQENTVCAGQSVEFSVSNVGADTYTWFLPTGMSIQGQQGIVTGLSHTELVTMDANTGAAVQIGVSGIINSCGVSSDTIYTADILFNGTGCQLEDPVFTAQADTVCEGETLIFTVNSVTDAESYVWSVSPGLQQVSTGTSGTITTTANSITLQAVSTGNLGAVSVRAQAPLAGIQSSNTISSTNAVEVITTPDFTVNINDVSACGLSDGGLVLSNLLASTTYSFSYFDGATTQGPFDIFTGINGVYSLSGLAVGDYSMLVVAKSSCATTDNKVYTITAGDIPVSLAAYADVCQSDLEFILAGGMPAGGTYSGAGINGGNFNPAIAGVGKHLITYEYTAQPGCSNTDTASIVVKPMPNGTLMLSDDDGQLCQGTAAEFIATGGDNYRFTLNGFEIQNSSNSIFTLTSPTNGDLVGVEVTLNGCSSILSDITIGVTPLPQGTLFASDDSICYNSPVEFTASGGAMYSFMINGQEQAYQADSVFSTNVLAQGDVVSVKIEGNNSCAVMAQDSIIMHIFSTPKSTIEGETEICPNTSGVSYSADFLPDVEYTWQLVSGGNYTQDDINRIDVDWEITSEGEIALHLIDTISNCEFDTSIYVYVVDDEAPVFSCPQDIEVKPELVNAIWQYQIKEEDMWWVPLPIENCSDAGYNLSFRVNDGVEYSDSAFLGTVLSDVNNQIEWIAIDRLGNQSEECITNISLVVTESIPTAFSPNNDQVNDYWEMPFLETYPNCKVFVFNRNGNLVFESKGYNGSNQWDGTFNGESLPVDSYHYVIQLKDGEKPLKGSVTIIK